MKKLMFLIAVMTFTFVNVAAQEFTFDGLRYSIQDENSCDLIGYDETQPTGELAIPSEVTFEGRTYSVARIIDMAFKDCADITSVDIPDTVTGDLLLTFSGCTSLKEAVIGNSVRALYMTFEGCTALESVKLSDNLKYIHERTFYACTSLETIILPATLEKIGRETFAECISLTKIIIPHTITTIETSTFANCESLIEVELPENLVKIEDTAFYGCSSLQNLNFPEALESIEDWAFANCKSIQNLNFNSSLKQIDAGAFKGCISLCLIEFSDAESPLIIDPDNFEDSPLESLYCKREIILRNENAVIEKWKSTIKEIEIWNSPSLLANWSGSPALQTVVIYNDPNSQNTIQIIPDNCFAECHNLKTISISGVETIGICAFGYLSKLETLTLEDVREIGSRAFTMCSNLKSLTLEGVREIGSGAFEDCRKLANLKLPDTIEKIEGGAFLGYSYLNNLNLSNCFRLEYIGSACFQGFTSDFDTLSIPGSVQYIGKYAFDGPNIKKVTFQQGIKEIGELAVAADYIIMENLVPPITANPPFMTMENLTVPKESFEVYSSTEPWNQFQEIREGYMTLLKLNSDSIIVDTFDKIDLDEVIKTNLTNEMGWNHYIISLNPDIFSIETSDKVYGISHREGECTLRIVAYQQEQVKAAECKVIVKEGAGVNLIRHDYDDKIKVFDVNGVLCHSGKLSDASLQPGLYIVVGSGATQKLIIK
ncbi:MAG: leucine-rich repeat protein [Bacteroides sp.]|nr:leucine-rich repeat protein [Bacteroides sp.]